MAARKFVVTGEQFVVIDDRMREIKRQLRQDSGSPLDPNVVATTLQCIIEGIPTFPTVSPSRYRLTVNYNEFCTLVHRRYYSVNGVTILDYPETETGSKSVEFDELGFDRCPTDQELRDRLNGERFRHPSRAEADTAIRRYSNQQLLKNPRIGITGPNVLRGGSLCRASVRGDEFGVSLGCTRYTGLWNRDNRIVVVRNDNTIA